MIKHCRLKIFFIISTLFACQHYDSNVEIVYKNANGASYNQTGSNIFKANDDEEKQNYYTKQREGEPIQQETISTNSANKIPPASSNNTYKQPEGKPIITQANNSIKSESIEASGKEQYHVVQKGETYYSIARLYFISPVTLIKINGADSKQVLKTGTIIKLYEESDVKQAKPVVNEKPIIKEAQIAKQPAKTEQTQKMPENKVLSIAGSSSCGEKFIIPIASKNILHNFGATLDGGIKNDGTIFKITSEEPIFASNKGEVAYVGDGFSDYGNIIILKHANSYFSIYGYLKSITLTKGQIIAKGEKVGTSSIKDGKFYFSIRKGKTAINMNACL